MPKVYSHAAVPISTTLAEGWRLFIAGLTRAFPWVLFAEALPLLGSATASKNILTLDLSRLFNPLHIAQELLLWCLQTFLYGLAIAQLARVAGRDAPSSLRTLARSIPALLIAYVMYQLIVYVGFGIALILFLITALVAGVAAGVVAMFIPLAPTAYISTLFALFAYPAVLERKGPFAALVRSQQLTRSNWGHAALVISVPAIVMLAIAMLAEAPFFSTLWPAMHQLLTSGSGMDAASLQGLLSNPKLSGVSAHRFGWPILMTVLTALGWWYALAVCYAEYRGLSSRTDH
jgi:hypothetical protein